MLFKRLVQSLRFVGLFSLLGLLLLATRARAAEPTIITISDTVQLSDVKRFGINIGGRDQFGAANYLKNVVPNPGFESAEFGMIFLTQANSNSWRVQADWTIGWNPATTGHPNGFWDGGNYEVVSGPNKWQRGTIHQFKVEDSRYTFYLNGLIAAPTTGDAVIVHKQVAGYDYNTNQYNRAEPNDKRPNSPGKQALRLLQTDESWKASWQLGLDTFGAPSPNYYETGDPGAGKLFLVNGNWYFSVWAKGSKNGDTLRMRFQRSGESVFFDETIPLTNQWQQITRSFNVANNQDVLYPWSATMPRNPILVELFAGGGEILVDDMELQRGGQTNPTEFSDKFVDYLTELQPGIIRNWGGERGQLGSTLDNQLAVQFGRKTTEYRPEHRKARGFHYSLHDFLVLCKLVGAEPWYVIPPTFTREEMTNLAAYLGAPAGSNPYADIRASLGQQEPWTSVFKMIHLEYGNEIWGNNGSGDPFLGASVRGGVRAGDVASARLGIFKQSPYFNEPKYNFAVGGQAFYPTRQKEIDEGGINQTSIGLAPYYGELETYATDSDRFNPLYGQASWLFRDSHITDSLGYLKATGKNTRLAVYEINLGATRFKGISLDERNSFITGQGAAVSLPLLMMQYQKNLGMREIISFQALQFSQYISGLGTQGEYVRLMGMLRDLEATGRKRPTWLAVQLANIASNGNLIKTDQSGSNPSYTYKPSVNNGLPAGLPDTEFDQSDVSVRYVQSFAYKSGDSYRLALYNLHLTESQDVKINLPNTPTGGAILHSLSADSPYTNNEDGNNVAIQKENVTLRNGYELTLKPHSMYVLEWGGSIIPIETNVAPVAKGDLILYRPNQSATIQLLDNDTDENKDPLKVNLVTTPSHGILTFNENGVVSYRPADGYTGEDSFTYYVTDGKLNSQTVTVQIRAFYPNNFVYLPVIIK